MKLYPKTWKSLLFAFTRLAIALSAVTFLLLYFCQEYLIFPGTRLANEFTFHFQIPFVEKFINVDGLKIHSLLFEPPESSGLILYFHGNGGSLNGWGDAAAELAEREHMQVWILDYPGYGKSDGKIVSEVQLHRIAQTFLEAAQSLNGQSSNIVLYGRSIGTGLAVKLAAEHQVRGLILESPYLSLESLAEKSLTWAPLFLLKYKFHSDQWLPQVGCPILILHGDEDEVIPFQQGHQLSQLSNNSKFVQISGGHHNDLSRFPKYWESLDDFVSSLP